MPTLYLIDASFFVFRAYHSMPAEMADADGLPVNALYGFAKFIGDLIERERPEHIAVAFDESLESSFRNRIYPAYKANREPAPVELKHQFERCRELCRLLGLAEFASSEFEADDIIGTLAASARAHGYRCSIVTRDKDLAQLVRSGDEFWDYVADVRIGYDGIPERFGVRPERIADYLALTGDAVDNIPGVSGIGPKTASALLAEFSSLEDIYTNIDRVTRLGIRGAASVAARLAADRETAFLARELTRIVCDAPFAHAPSGLRRNAPQIGALADFYDRAGFGSMLRRQAERIAGH